MDGKYFIHDFLKESYPISQKYGENVDYYKSITNGGLTKGHEGVDFKTPNGTEIFAPFDGIVVRDTFDAKAYGNFLVIWDPIQLCALWFCHLQDTVVAIQDHVKAGQLVAHSNNTGNTTGPHVHVNFVETDAEGIRLLTGNGEEGFLNLMDSTLVTYPWLPCAALVPPGTPLVTVSTAKLKIGDTATVTADIPVGKDIGMETFAYGTLGPKAPAKVIGLGLLNGIVYYDIDQAVIGGGTGWVRADLVDANLFVQTVPLATPESPKAETPAQVPEEVPLVISTPSVNDMETQRNDALGKLKEISDKYNADLSNYTALQAAGFSTVTDISTAMSDIQKQNTGLKKQLLEVLERNRLYLTDMANKEKEDATAIEIGMTFERKYNELKQFFTSMARMYNVKPNFDSITGFIENLKTAYDSVSKELRQKNTKESIALAKAVEATTVTGKKPGIFDPFLTIFGFR